MAKAVLTLAVIVGGVFAAVHAWSWFTGTYGAPTASVPPQDQLQQARQFVDQGNWAAARPLLESLAASSAPSDSMLEALRMLAKLDQQEGRPDEARKRLEKAYREFASSPEYPRVAAAYARSLEEAGSMAEAVPIYEEIRAKAPREFRPAAWMGLGRNAEQMKDLVKARELYRQAVQDAAWDSADWNEGVDALGRVNVALVFLPGETPDSRWHTVQKGDSITRMGNDLNVTQGMLMRANSIDETTRLNIGQRLKYTPKDFRIVIDRSRCRLFLLDKDGLFKRYPVGLGKPGHETTLGSYKIGNKEKDPIWHKPGAGAIPAGDPANELGTRWMPLVPEQEGLPTDLGIHGTIRPETIGQYSSNGCARLLPQDVEELYDLVVRSTPVDIVESFTPDQMGPSETAPAGSPTT